MDSFEQGGFRVEFHRDEDVSIDDVMGDTLGTITTWHRRYSLGTPHKWGSADEFRDSLAQDYAPAAYARWEREMDDLGNKFWARRSTLDPMLERDRRSDAARLDAALWESLGKHVLILPVYMYDHSGITLSTSPFSCPWDSGQVGYIWVTREAVLKEYGRKHMSKKLWATAQEILECEVELLDKLVQGDVWYYTITRLSDEEVVDSCGLLVGEDRCLEEAKQSLQYYLPPAKKDVA